MPGYRGENCEESKSLKPKETEANIICKLCSNLKYSVLEFSTFQLQTSMNVRRLHVKTGQPVLMELTRMNANVLTDGKERSATKVIINLFIYIEHK